MFQEPQWIRGLRIGLNPIYNVLCFIHTHLRERLIYKLGTVTNTVTNTNNKIEQLYCNKCYHRSQQPQHTVFFLSLVKSSPLWASLQHLRIASMTTFA